MREEKKEGAWARTTARVSRVKLRHGGKKSSEREREEEMGGSREGACVFKRPRRQQGWWYIVNPNLNNEVCGHDKELGIQSRFPRLPNFGPKEESPSSPSLCCCSALLRPAEPFCRGASSSPPPLALFIFLQRGDEQCRWLNV
ncbi:hypothetical protein INR49_009722 [Caranx melampygus]|nr:hypothetical protein INR49_009722 [Caranx melampygus]